MTFLRNLSSFLKMSTRTTKTPLKWEACLYQQAE